MLKKLWNKLIGKYWEQEFDMLRIITEKYKTITDKLLEQKEEGEAFINHIAKHIKETNEVKCITCGKTSEAIHKEWKSKNI